MLRFFKLLAYFFINIWDLKFDFPLPPKPISRILNYNFWITFLNLYFIRKEKEKKYKNNFWTDISLTNTSFEKWLNKLILVQSGTLYNKRAYEKIKKDQSISNILDAGCGSGASSAVLLFDLLEYRYPNGKLNNNYEKFIMHGIDLNSDRINTANLNLNILFEHYKEKINFNFLQGNLNSIKANDNYYDYSIVPSVLDYLKDHEIKAVVKELCRVTKKGIFIVDFQDKYPMNKVRDHNIHEALFLKEGFSVDFYEYGISNGHPKHLRNNLMLYIFFTKN